MKNKYLRIVVIILFILLSIEFVKGKQQAIKSDKKEIPTVGVLQFVSHPALDEIYRGIEEGLEKRGYEKDKSIKIVLQNGQADQSKLSTMSQQLHDKKADVLIGIATPAAQALANSKEKTPIVLGAISDPKGAGLVPSNEKPGGHITGVSDVSPVKAQFELVKKILPHAKKVGILYSSAEDNSEFLVQLAEKAAENQGYTIKKYPVPSGNEVSQMVQVMTTEVDVIYIPTDNTIANAMQTVVDLANKRNIPIIPSVDTMVEQGGLATVGINQFKIGTQVAEMTADILEGKAEPATTPIYTFTEGDIVVNDEQAKKLGINIPEDIKQKAKRKE